MKFRIFVQEMWYQYKDEIEYWERSNPGFTMKEYFAKYKWWLREVYRKQFNNN